MTFIPQSRISVGAGIIAELNQYGPDDGCATANPILSTSVPTTMSDFIETNTNDDGIDRRGFLKCMAWAGTGVIWSINGGLLTSTVLGQEANNRGAIATAEMNFVQISDSHIGFNKPANTDVVGTFRETIMHINALPKVPEFLLHTGDLTHLSDPGQFDTLAQVLKECKTTDVFYVPGEHDIYDGGAQYRERFYLGRSGRYPRVNGKAFHDPLG